MNAIQEPSKTKIQPEPKIQDGKPTALANLHKRHRNKKQRKRQTSKYKDDYDKVINELKQRHSKELVSEKQELNLVDKPKCGYFKAYEISADKYKDPNKLFRDKKSVITQQIVKKLKELGGLKFQLGLTIIFYKDDDAEKKIVTGVLHGQMAILTTDKIDEFYNNSSAQIQTGIEKFTNAASGLEIDHCIKIYLNIAKYEPLKGSSYIPLPKALANKKAMINVKNDDNKCLEWALKSALYPAKTNVCNKYRYTKYGDLNMNSIDFPTPISQIPKVEKQNNLAINVYGYTMSKKVEKITIFPYHISNQPNEMSRINLLLISEDVEVEEKESDEEGIIDDNYDPDAPEEPKTTSKKETKYHYCWIKNLSRLLCGQNSKYEGKTHFCDCCRYVSHAKTYSPNTEKTASASTKTQHE